MKPSTIEEIVHRHLAEESDADVQTAGLALLGRWKQSPPGTDFCKTEVVPAIRTFTGQARRKGWSLLHKIKNDIADTAADEARRAELQRQSAERMKQELLHGYHVIDRQGRGVLYLGSARSKPGDPDYEAGRELGREIAALLKVTSWSGAGPGAMEAPILGAKEAGGAIGGIKILLNQSESAFEQEVSQVFRPEEVAQMPDFGPRKVCLVDAAMAEDESQRRAAVILPGGYGTLDEFFELLTLKQLNKLGTKRKLRILLMNYGGYYQELLDWLRDKVLRDGKIKESDLTDIFNVCSTNKEALDHLAREFGIPEEERTYDARLQPWSTWYPDKPPTPEYANAV